MTDTSDPGQLDTLLKLHEQWEAAWPEALAVWSRFTKLKPPVWCLSDDDAWREGLRDSFAMIRLHDQAIVINLLLALQENVQEFAREILAHEIGHHIYVPADLLGHGRMLARIRRGLPQREQLAPLVANLYADLLINDRLQRQAGLRMDQVYRALRGGPQRPLWTFYSRTYEILWSLPRGSLAEPPWDRTLEADAGLAARLIRSFAREWLDGAGRYAVLCLPYLLEESRTLLALCAGMRGWCDTVAAAQGAAEAPAGLIEIDPSELDGILHPLFDPELSGVELDQRPIERVGRSNARNELGNSPGQCREPFEYGEILRALGLNLSDHDAAVRYYRERALPHLVKFPVHRSPKSSEPLPEGTETWDLGQPLDRIDWLQTAITSPVIIPGFTTQQQVWGSMEGGEPKPRPVDLDLYVDCSGSMPNPQRVFSPIALAGAIVALSALRVGSRVQATLWSGAGEFETTAGFVRDTTEVLRVLTGYLGGGTAFPLHVLRDTYVDRKPTDRSVHVLVISDSGVTTMFSRDERGRSGWEICRQSLERARGGGSMLLNLWKPWTENRQLVEASQQGWDLYVVRTLEELVPFAREFSRRHYQKDDQHAG